MRRSLRIMTFVALLLTLVASEWGTTDATVSAQGTRLRRAPGRDLDSTPPLPAGTRVVPQGWPIILEMETRLSSSTSRISDRFRAHVAQPVTDDGGKTLIPIGTVVEGHVSAVKKAKWAHRSGFVALVFDNFRTPDGRAVPVRATLTSADVADRKRLNEEGTIRGGNPTRRDIIFIGGGAGAGAAIGVFTGGALLGGGIGAAAGLTATLLLKGKDAVVEAGQRFGMELVQPFSADSIAPRRISTPIYGRTGDSGRGTNGGAQAGPLDPRDVSVERMGDGTVRLHINAETPTSGWRVYTHHDVIGSVARVRLRGTPLSRGTTDSFFQTGGVAPAPEICLNDRAGTLRRAEIMGRDGTLRIAVDIPVQVGAPRFARAQPRPIPVNPGASAGIYQPINQPVASQPPIAVQPPASSPGSTAGSTLAQSAINQVDVILMQYAFEIGYLREPNGQFRFIGSRAPTQAQKQLLDSLSALQASLLTLRGSLGNSLTQRNSAQRVQEDAQNVQRVQMQVSLSADLNRKWANAYRDIGTLVNATGR